MKHTFFSRLFFFIAFALPLFSRAQDGALNVVSTAVPFLRISPDARAGGMGDVGIASLPDANSGFWNSSKIPFTDQHSAVGATYTPWLSDVTTGIYLATVSGFHKLDDNQAISASLRYFDLGNIQFSDYSGNPLGSYQPREFSFDMGYSRKLSDQFGIGLTLRYINSKLASGDANNSGLNYKAANAVAGDISFYYNGLSESGEGWTAGAVVSNLGSKVSYTSNDLEKDYLPANLGLGVAYTVLLEEDSQTKLTLGLDLNRLLVPMMPSDSAGMSDYYRYGVVQSWFKSFGSANGGIKSIQASLGAEFSFYNQFMLRTGYFYENANEGDRKYVTLGLGFKYNIAGLNLSYLIPSGSGVTRNPLSNTLRFGVTFDLDQKQ